MASTNRLPEVYYTGTREPTEEEQEAYIRTISRVHIGKPECLTKGLCGVTEGSVGYCPTVAISWKTAITIAKSCARELCAECLELAQPQGRRLFDETVLEG